MTPASGAFAFPVAGLSPEHHDIHTECQTSILCVLSPSVLMACVLLPFYRWGNRCSEKYLVCSEVTQLETGKPVIWSVVWCHIRHFSAHFLRARSDLETKVNHNSVDEGTWWGQLTNTVNCARCCPECSTHAVLPTTQWACWGYPHFID